jgi:phage terminase large subunit
LQLGMQYTICRNIPVMDGIDAARIMLKRCWFDQTKCANGVEALRNYRSQYDDKLRIESLKPLHDWTSHGADAFRYAAVTWGAPGNQPSLLGGERPDLSRFAKRAI